MVNKVKIPDGDWRQKTKQIQEPDGIQQHADVIKHAVNTKQLRTRRRTIQVNV